MTKFQLMTAFFTNTPIDVKGVRMYLDKIEREDGSGSSFNLSGQVPNTVKGSAALYEPATVYVRTVD